MLLPRDYSQSSWAKVLFRVSLGVMVAVDVLSIGEVLWGNKWIGNWLWISPAAFSTTFVGTAILVRRRGLSHMESFLVALTTMVSMIWMYEIIYHFGFYADWEFGTQAQAAVLATYNQPVLTDVLLASVGLVSLKYMHVGLPFFISFAGLLLVFGTWVAIGYPQVLTPGQVYPFGAILIHVSNPDAWAYPLNTLTKFLLGLTYISLYLGKPIRSRM